MVGQSSSNFRSCQWGKNFHSGRGHGFTLSLWHEVHRILHLLECCLNWNTVMRAGWAFVGLRWTLRCWREVVVYPYFSWLVWDQFILCRTRERVCACSVFVCLNWPKLIFGKILKMIHLCHLFLMKIAFLYVNFDDELKDAIFLLRRKFLCQNFSFFSFRECIFCRSAI